MENNEKLNSEKNVLQKKQENKISFWKIFLIIISCFVVWKPILMFYWQISVGWLSCIFKNCSLPWFWSFLWIFLILELAIIISFFYNLYYFIKIKKNSIVWFIIFFIAYFLLIFASFSESL